MIADTVNTSHLTTHTNNLHVIVTTHNGFIDSPWWQVIFALTVAFATAFFTHYFSAKRKKRQTTLSTAAELIAAARQLRRNYLGFAEYQVDFNRQSRSYFNAAKAKQIVTQQEGQLSDEQIADISKTAANAAQTQSQIYQREILETQNKIDKAYFTLLGISAHVRKDDELKKALEALLDYKFITVHEDLKQPSEDINNHFKPNLNIIQARLGRLLEMKSWSSQNYKSSANKSD